MPKLILCSEHREIAKELRRQLKSYGLTVKFKSRREDDQITVEVSKLPPPTPVKCPDCGLMSNDSRCCQNDQDLWK